MEYLCQFTIVQRRQRIVRSGVETNRHAGVPETLDARAIKNSRGMECRGTVMHSLSKFRISLALQCQLREICRTGVEQFGRPRHSKRAHNHLEILKPVR